MRELTSLERQDMPNMGRHSGTYFMVYSPIEAPRNFAQYKEALGPVKIDGIEREVTGVEWHMPATPVYVGEQIALRVRWDK